MREKRPFVIKVVRAFTEALHFIKTKKEETKALIAKNLKTNNPEGLERAYRAYNGAFPDVPYPNAEGVKTLLDDIAPRTPKAATRTRPDLREKEKASDNVRRLLFFNRSARRGLNPRPSGWEPDALPLSYSRKKSIRISERSQKVINCPVDFLNLSIQCRYQP